MRLSRALWDEQTPPLERVYAVVFGLSYPVDPSYVADHAKLSVETARHHLEQLRDLQIVEVESYGRTRLYSFAEDYLNIRSIYRLCTQRTLSELDDMYATLSDQIEMWQREYDISSPQAALDDADDSPGSSTPPPLILGEWLFLTHYQTLIQKAQALLSHSDESPTEA